MFPSVMFMLLVDQFTQKMETMFVLVLILLSAAAVYPDSHSLRYYYVGVSAPGSGLPEFSIVGYVDDQQTDLYRSDVGRTVPVAPWAKRNEKPKYWEESTQYSKEDEALFRREVKITMKRLNHTGGFHFVQVLMGCELRDDGSTTGYQLYQYDGREYMFLDTQTATFIPTMAEAQITTEKWNRPDAGLGQRGKLYLQNECMERLKTYIEYGREDLERRVRPGVKVSGQESDGVTKLHCQVYGFHPKAVDVKWMKNGIDQVPSYQTTHVLPNPDGTYQIRVTVEVIPQEGDSYSCYVDHSSLEEPLLVRWEPPQDSPRTVIIIVVIIVLVLTSVTAGVIIYRKKKDNYEATGTSDSHESITA